MLPLPAKVIRGIIPEWQKEIKSDITLELPFMCINDLPKENLC
jgi:hypothetical protein